MSQKKIFIKKYKALGFIEALLAILVTGITSLILMRIAVDTIRQGVKNEQADSMTQVAIESASKVKTVAEKNNNSAEKLFPDIAGNINNCFAITGSVGDPKLDNDNGEFIPICNYDAGGRDSCKGAVSDENSDLFEVFCITPESVSSSGLVVGKMVVGKIKCKDSESCDVSDYEYFVLTKTLQK